jgi:hypothetical protein
VHQALTVDFGISHPKRMEESELLSRHRGASKSLRTQNSSTLWTQVRHLAKSAQGQAEKNSL